MGAPPLLLLLSPSITAPNSNNLDRFCDTSLDSFFEQILNENGCPVVYNIRNLFFNQIDTYHDLDLALELYRFYRDHPDYIILFDPAKSKYKAIKPQNVETTSTFGD